MAHLARSDIGATSAGQAQAFYEQVLVGLPGAAALFDLKGRYCFVNAAAVSDPQRRRWLIGRTPVEAAQHLGDNHEAARRLVAFVHVVAREQRSLEYEETIERASGREQLVHCTLAPVVGLEGRVTHVLVYGDDLTAHRHAESALDASQKRLALYREQAPLGFIEWSIDFHVRDWNPAAEALFGYTREEALGRHPKELLGVEALRGRERVVWRALLRHEGGYRTTVEHQTKDGRTVVCEWLNTPVIEADGHVVAIISIVQDVTERQRHEQQLIAAKEEAEAVAQLKSTIINNISHEIRTPLTAILGFAEVLISEVPEGEQRQFAQLIDRSGRRLMSTLNAVLDLARLESGEMNFHPHLLDLYVVAEEAVTIFQQQADQKGIALKLACTCKLDQTSLEETSAEKLWVPAYLDPDGIHRVISNLLSNAIKFTRQGAVRVEVGAGATDVYVSVTDTGLGISASFLPSLFEEFKQESEGLARHHEGSGLGLAITRRLVEGMSGTITVESEKGAGSTFTVRFPTPATPPQD